jgi:hypothetical protein
MRIFTFILFKLENYYLPVEYVLLFFSFDIGLSVTIAGCLELPKLPLPKVILD